ncbi:protein of unknown function [Aminobacter niigataensis]|nr:protein of unknown function [Aminobacter niigataensis]
MLPTCWSCRRSTRRPSRPRCCRNSAAPPSSARFSSASTSRSRSSRSTPRTPTSSTWRRLRRTTRGLERAVREANEKPQNGLFERLKARSRSEGHSAAAFLAPLAEWAKAPKLLISLLVGEMPGRAEGGAKDREAPVFRSAALWV